MTARGPAAHSGAAVEELGREPLWWIAIRVLDGFVRLAVRLPISGLSNIPASGPAIVVANHVSYLDPLVLIVLAHRRGRKMRFLGSREAFERPVSGWWIRAGHHIPVGAGGEGTQAIRQAKAALDRGDLVMVYPEGTIPGAEPVQSAKGAAGLLALTCRVPVIPVATTGLERGPAPWWRRRRASAVVGVPIDLRGPAPASGRRRYEAASDLLLAAIRDLVPTAEERARQGHRLRVPTAPGDSSDT
ncbi:MAG: 1-acyl-sn-glycerol-3-phosphate acyltransferase [Actinomycetota bacterium]|nr:1-acyl-sn-glycerol-3-phosphate acyltransferase [Actinomycetota bacterium]